MNLFGGEIQRKWQSPIEYQYYRNEFIQSISLSRPWIFRIHRNANKTPLITTSSGLQKNSRQKYEWSLFAFDERREVA